MTTLRFAEVFGFGVDDSSSEATECRKSKWCPFRDAPCTKSSKTNPLGVCSLSDGEVATALCPVRFREKDRIFVDAARIAFGEHVRFAPVPELKILRDRSNKRIGKIDYLLAKLDHAEEPVDFAALEVQAVYFSGGSIRTALERYLRDGKLDESDCRRPDYRSCAQKRLMPQLSLKVPVFRRWGKRFFVAVDSLFFDALPRFNRVKPANTEITWLVYRIAKRATSYQLAAPEICCSVWDDVLGALREGEAPEPGEIVTELRNRMSHNWILQT